MKKVSNIYDKITNINTIMQMYKNISKNIKNKNSVLKFEEFYTYNIKQVQNLLLNKNYTDIKYNIFLVKEPKYRIVMSQNVHDKLINHLVAKYFLIDVLESSLIDSNVATRKNKGTLYGIKLLKKYFVKLINNNETIYALKFDIHKYFYSIDHNKIMNLLKTKIDDSEVLNIINNILVSTNKEYVNLTINNIKKNEIKAINNLKISQKEKILKIEEVNKIPLYECDKGLPIGNMTSQILAICYLNELDHYIKEKLNMKYYIRYMDDGLILSNRKEELIKCLEEISKIISNYHLKLNKKTAIVNVNKNGIDFLGFKFYIKNKKIIMKVRENTKKKFIRKAKQKDTNIINYYKSHLKYGNCFNIFKKYVG